MNLTLYNRDVVYDQDFSVKNELTIAPQQNGRSFADPIITTNTFTVEPGITSNFIAGKAIYFEPGTELSYGSIVEASINPNLCSDVHLAPHSSSENRAITPQKYVLQSDTVLLNNTTSNNQTNTASQLYPNPNKGEFTVVYLTEQHREQ